MKKMNIYLVIWVIIIVILVALLTVFGFLYKDKNKIYKELENKIVEAEKKYVDAKFLYPQGNQVLKTKIEELKNEKYLEDTKVNDEDCTGYIEVYLDGTVYKYKSYIKCDNYETKGYEE